VGARFSAPLHTGPGAHPAFCTMGTESFLGVKSGRVVTLPTHPLLLPLSRKSTAIPVLPLWAVLPVRNISACTTVHFTLLYLISSGRSVKLTNHSPPSTAEVKDGWGYSSAAPIGPRGAGWVNFTFTLTVKKEYQQDATI